MNPESIMAEGATDEIQGAIAARIRSRSTGVQRILLDAMSGSGGGGKAQQKVTGGETESLSAPIDRISEEFEQWHLILQGEPGQQAIDAVLESLGGVWNNLRLSETNPEQSAALLPPLAEHPDAIQFAIAGINCRAGE